LIARGLIVALLLAGGSAALALLIGRERHAACRQSRGPDA